MERVILHCDLNNFYASVECLMNPELANYPVAVCGNKEERRGIVLAKNEKAKKYGVKTAEVIWQAKKKCPNLLIVPPHHREYKKYSQKVRAIYERYTDQVEAFGIDECYLDVTGSTALFGSGYEIALQIKETVKRELGLTISVGVSFNKIFAKLGSDMKKPDAITCIPSDSYQKLIWNLPANEMLGVGKKTAEKLALHGYESIGDIAKAKPEILESLLGKIGKSIWRYANGLDDSAVASIADISLPKSVGHGMTTVEDLKDNREVWLLVLSLTQEISKRLHRYHLSAGGVAISVRNNQMEKKEFQCQLPFATQSASLIAKQAMELFEKNYRWQHFVRLITVTAINLQSEKAPRQVSLLEDNQKQEKLEKIDLAVESLRERYGEDIVKPALLLDNESEKGKKA